jgi:hypothetical protein
MIAVPVIAQSRDHARMGVPENRPSFEELDTNSDGSVTVAEIKAHMAARFAQQDANGDGVLSSDEMVAAMAAKMAERMAQGVDRMIEWRDTDGDGALSQAEMGGGKGERMFEHADADGDGAISADEFEKAGKRTGPRNGQKGERGKMKDKG